MSEVRTLYEQQAGWGLSVSIDLHGCKQETVVSEDKIREFAAQLAATIGLTPAGDCSVTDSGATDETAGYTFTQLFPAGYCSGHFVAKTGIAFLDIFSPQYFDPEQAAASAEKFFEAQDAVLHYVVRK